MDELNEGPRVGLLGAVALALVAFPASAQGWRMSGLGAPAYDVTTVSPGACAPRAARIRSNGEEAKGPVAVLQSFKAGAYRGSRVRYSAMVDAKALGGWAGLLFHVEGAGDKALLVDDMSNRPVRGTQACTRLAVVLEVPPEAEVLSVGVAVDGPGTLEFGDIALEKVGDEVPVTVGPRVPQGRIGDLTFTETALTGTIAWGRKVQVARQASGEWRDERKDIEARMDGDKVVARFVEFKDASTDEFGNRPVALALQGDFTLTHNAGSTLIEGQWGTALVRQPVRIALSPARLEMRWGVLQRTLRHEPGRAAPEGCWSYAAGSGKDADRLLVCGSALGVAPPPVQTVLAFLVEGFRRPESGPGM